MSNDPIKILIDGALNKEGTKVTINEQLRQISQEIEKLKIGIHLDKESIQSLKDLSDQTDKLKQTMHDRNRVVKETITEIHNLDGTIKRIATQENAAGEIFTSTTTKIKQQEEETKKLTNEVNKLGRVKQLVYEIGKNGERQLVREVRQTQDLTEQIIRYNKQGQVTSEIQKENIELRRREEKRIEEQNKKLRQQLEIFKRQMEINRMNLERRYNRGIDTQGLERIMQNVRELNVDTPELSKKMQDLRLSFKEFEAQAATSGSRVVSFSEQLRIALERVPIWMIAMTAFYGTIRGIRDAIRQNIEIDTQMVELARVSNNEIARDHILRESISLAERLGNTILDINEGIITFARMGFRGEGLIQLTEASTLFSNISELNVDEAADGLTAIINGFRMLPEEALSAVDAINEVDNNFAITSANIVASMQKAVGAANTFGVSMHELIGYTTAIGEVTRESGNIIGNSLRTIFSRITTMQPVIDSLAQIGISISDMEGNIRPVSEILTELAAKWDTLTSSQQQNIALQIAGRYQLSRFLVLMQNFDRAIAATEAALNSENSAIIENQAYLESLEARINMMKNAWTELALTMGDAFLTDTFVAVINVITSIANSVTGLINTVGDLPLLFGTIATVAAGLSRNFRILTLSVITLGNGLKGLGVSATVAKRSLRGLAASTAVGAIFATLGIALEGLIKLFSDSSDKISEFEQSIKESYQVYENNINQINKLQNAYEELINKKSLSTVEREELNQIREELSKYIPEIIKGYDNEGNAIYATYEEVSKLVEEYKNLNLERARFIANTISERVREDIKEVENLRKEISQLNVQFKTQQAEFQAISFVKRFIEENNLSELDRYSEEYINKINELRQGVQDIFNEFNVGINLDSFLTSVMMDYGSGSILKSIEGARSAYAETEEEIRKKTQEINNHLESLVAGLRARNDEIAHEFNVTDRSAKVFLDSLANEFVEINKVTTDNLDNIIYSYREFISELLRLNEEGKFDIENLNEENLVKIRNEINLLSSEFDGLKLPVSTINNYIENLSEGVSFLDDEFEDISDQLDDFTKAINSTISELKSLNKIIRDVEDGQSLNAETLADLILKYPQLAAHIYKTTDGYKLERDALEELRKMKIQEAKDAIDAQIRSKEATITNTLQRIKAYQIELDAIRDLNSARQQASNLGFVKIFGEDVFDKAQFDDATRTIKIGDAVTEWSEEMYNSIKRSFNTQKEINDMLMELGTLHESREKLLELMRDPTFGIQSSSSSKSSSSSSSKLKNEAVLVELDLTQQLARAFRAEYEARNRIIKSIQEKINLTDKDDYARLIDLQTKLIKEQELAIESLIKANSRLHNEANKLRKTNPDIDKWFDSAAQPTEYFINLLHSIRNNNNLTIEQRNKMIEQIQDTFKKMQTLKQAHMENTQEIINLRSAVDSAMESIKNLQEAYRQAVFSRSEEWIEREKRRMEMSGSTELEIAKMVLDARERMASESWARINGLEKLTNKEREQALYNLYLAEKEYLRLLEKNATDIEDSLKRAADQAIEIMKEYYRQQQRYAENFINNEIKKLEEAHRKKMQMLDEELNGYRAIVNEKLKSIERSEEEREFDKQLAEAQREAQEIRNKIAIKSLNDSLEARYELERLEEELAKKLEEIEELKHKRGIELRRQNLQDSLEAKEKEIENERKNSRYTINLYDKETRKIIQIRELRYEHAKELLEKEKQDHIQYWEDKLTNEREFNRIRMEIVKGNFDEINRLFDNFIVNIEQNMTNLSENIQNNLIDKINEAKETLRDAQNSISSNPLPVRAKYDSEVRQAHDEYVLNKFRWMDLYDKTGRKDLPEQIELNKRNEELRRKYGFKDYTREDLLNNRIEQFDTGGYTAEYEGLAFLHKKELVLNQKDTDNLLKVINVTRDIIGNMIKNINRSNSFAVRQPTINKENRTIIENLQIQVVGNYSRNDGQRLAKDIIRGLEAKGVMI